ncbi:MAG: hypothetical protein Q8O40_05945 [Chloroflexota bacterium]|nr:hypothetical protein [Chloroflexota bacterium]
MAKVDLGILKADIYERPAIGDLGPVRAKGRVTILDRPAPAAVLAVLLPTDAETPLAFGFGFTDSNGYYNVPIAIKGKNLPLGWYRVREAIFSLGPPIIQDVPVTIVPTMIAAQVLSSGVREGSVLAEILYTNMSVGVVDWTFITVALVQNMPAAAAFDPTQPGTLWITPLFFIPPGLTEPPPAPVLPPAPGIIPPIPPITIPDIPDWTGFPYGLVRGFKSVDPGNRADYNARGEIQAFDPLDPQHVVRLADIGDLGASLSRGEIGPDLFHAKMMDIANQDPTDFIHVSPTLRIEPTPDAPAGIYDGFAFVAEKITYGSEQTPPLTPPEDNIGGWIAPGFYPAVWRKIPPIVAAGIVSARWWVEE